MISHPSILWPLIIHATCMMTGLVLACAGKLKHTGIALAAIASSISLCATWYIAYKLFNSGPLGFFAVELTPIWSLLVWLIAMALCWTVHLILKDHGIFADVDDLRLEGVCPKCGYPLQGSHNDGCPECGWGRIQS